MQHGLAERATNRQGIELGDDDRAVLHRAPLETRRALAGYPQFSRNRPSGPVGIRTLAQAKYCGRHPLNFTHAPEEPGVLHLPLLATGEGALGGTLLDWTTGYFGQWGDTRCASAQQR